MEQFSFGFFGALGVATAAVTVFSVMLSDFFDTMGTVVACGLLFLVALVLSPLAGVVPPQATGAVLVIVGFQMMQDVGEIPWGEPLEAVPAFLAMIAMPFTYSITNGIGAGVVSYVVLAVAAGRARRVHVLLWTCAAAFVAYFAFGAG